MPVTKTAKRALRVSKRKEEHNKKRMTQIEIAVRSAVRTKKDEEVQKAISLIDRAAKNNIIHKNKAARMKSQLARDTKKERSKDKTTTKAKVKPKTKISSSKKSKK